MVPKNNGPVAETRVCCRFEFKAKLVSLWVNSLDAVTASASRVVRVRVDPVSSVSDGGFGVIVGDDDEEDDEAEIRVLLGFVREN
ncbi:hypothetical protein HanRHA438_Chr17g0816701 [Helianthus annuus]|nr:hypothetical protein HanRHA438_Chr17g0816701 [Helianthus annuus]